MESEHDEPLFNNNILKHRFLPEGIVLSKPKRELIETLPVGSKKKQSLIRLIADGIRIDPDSSSTYAGFLCVICDQKLPSLDFVNQHIAERHNEPIDLLLKTANKPVVGLDSIIEYRNDKNEIIQYECTLCKLFFLKHVIFWHVISYPHKEKFFNSKYSEHPISQMVDRKTKLEKIDQLLIEHENKLSDRGKFLSKPFTSGMIESVNISKLNMAYIRKLFPTETSKVNQLCLKEERALHNLKTHLSLQVQNPRQFARGKEILQEMNKALIDYSDYKV
ncbi:hypothetical protein RDWZM_002952 [Blomia tropicalis]|uniref:C2H2-type domain-containing protein n=1 Tax=Blomia tropicalis TaxID=40697 RepID=A0A9Q0MEY3_BLOTA|nr:hypothetical protein RDWZM_002952 [Blomia tropicalis]